MIAVRYPLPKGGKMAQATMRLAGESQRAMPRKIPFSKQRLEALLPAEGKRLTVYDTKTPHLGYTVTSNGAASFIWYGRAAGRPVRVRIGGAGELTVEQARRRAMEMTHEVATKGVNPAVEKRKASTAMTFSEVFKWYIEHHAKPNKRTWKDDELLYGKHLKGWASRPFKSIERADVKQLHSRIGKSHKYAANRVLALVSVVFNKARDLGFDIPNPTAGVGRFKETQRERFLSAEELARFLVALERADTPEDGFILSDDMRQFFGLCLWTGARRGNVQSMRWDELDLDRRIWTIPGSKAKAGKSIIVPLSDPAIEILNKRKGNESEWVFPSRNRDAKTPYMASPKKAWAELLRRAEIKDFRIHDLRRTFGSYQAISGSSLSVIGKSLGHSSTATTAIYARLNVDPVRESIEKATAAMQAAAKLAAKK